MKRTLRKLMYAWRYPRDFVFCHIKLGRWDPTWRLYGVPIIQKRRGAEISIGKKWIACSNPRYNSLGVFQPVILKALRPGAQILIGNNVGMSGVSISCATTITIGDDVLIGSGAVITDNDAHPIHPELREEGRYILMKEVKIGNKVFIGARAMILKGVTIGEGAVIGAGSIVVKDVAPMTIVAGNPAKVIGSVNDERFLQKKNCNPK